MKYIRAIMIVYTLAKIKESEMTTLSNRKRMLSYHDYDKTWNEAHEVCKLQGGSLYIEDSAEKTIVLQKFRDELDFNDEVWIGLYYPTVGLNNVYAWINCFWLDNTYDKYKVGEPDNTDTDKCILSKDDVWKTEECDKNKKFVCETPGADCTFNKTNGVPLDSPNFASITLSTADESLCETECMTKIHNNTNCWGLNFNTPGSCTLYFTTNPFFFTSIATYDNSTVTMSIKICYTYALVESDNFTHIVNNSETPREECTSYFDSATTTTTTTTVPPTTTTAPPTTTTTAPPTTTTAPSTTTTTAPPTTTTTSTPPSSAPPTTTTTTLTSTSTLSTTTTAAEPTTSAITTSTSANINSTSCICQCSDLSTLLGNYTTDPDWKNLTVEEKVELLVTRLRVDKRKLSSFVRKKTSAPDDRAVSVSVGYLAISFISIIFGLIIVSDGINFLKYLIKNKKPSPDNVSVSGVEDSSL